MKLCFLFQVSSSRWIDIHDFRLDELKLTEVETLSSALAMFQDLDLIKVLKIDEKVSLVLSYVPFSVVHFYF